MANFDPFRGFKAASDIAGKVTDPYEEERKFNRQLELERVKSGYESPKDKSIRMLNEQKLKNLQEPGASQRQVYAFSDATGEIEEAGSVPIGARVFKRTSQPLAKIQASASAETMNRQIDDLSGLIKSGAKFKGALPFGGLDKEGQRFQLIVGDLGDRLLRLRSGAQINEGEYRRLSNLLPKFWRDNEIDLEQLNKFKLEFGNILGRVQSGQINALDETGTDSPMTNQQQGGQSFPPSSGQPTAASQDVADFEAIKQRLKQRYYGK